MAKTLASLVVRIGADVTGVTAGLSTVDKRIRSLKKEFGSVRDSTLKWQSALATLAGAAGLGLAAKKVFDLGAAVEETASKFATTLGPETQTAQRFLDEFASTAGLTIREGQDLVATTAAIAQGMGFSRKGSAALAEEITRLSGDLSSFNNIPIAETSRAIQSALTGERESLKRLGIVILETDVQKKALAMTGKTVAASLTQQEKVTATLALITERAGVAVGDLGRTMDSPANRARKLTADLLTVRDSIAHGLLPAFSVFLDALSGSDANLKRFGNTLKDNSARVMAWAKFTVEALKFVAEAFMAPIRAAFEFGQMIGRLGTAYLSMLKGDVQGVSDALQLLRGDFGQFLDVGAGVVDRFVAMHDAAAAAWSTLGDGQSEIVTTTQNLTEMAAAAETAASAIARASGTGGVLSASVGARSVSPVFRSAGIRLPSASSMGISARAVPGGFDRAVADFRAGMKEGFQSFKEGITDFKAIGSNLVGNLAGAGVSFLADKAFKAIGDLFDSGAEKLARALEQNTRALQAGGEFLAARLTGAGQMDTAKTLRNVLETTRDRVASNDSIDGIPIRTFGKQATELTFLDELRKHGLSFDQAKSVAETLGIQLIGADLTPALQAFFEQIQNATGAVQKFADALNNVPAGFRVARARFNASEVEAKHAAARGGSRAWPVPAYMGG